MFRIVKQLIIFFSLLVNRLKKEKKRNTKKNGVETKTNFGSFRDFIYSDTLIKFSSWSH